MILKLQNLLAMPFQCGFLLSVEVGELISISQTWNFLHGTRVLSKLCIMLHSIKAHIFMLVTGLVMMKYSKVSH